jgi:transposase
LRGTDERTGALFSYVDLEARVRKDHPLRVIRTVVNEALVTIEREIASLYSETGRPSIAPERLLRAMLLQAFYSIRSERQLMERIEFDLLFRWFVGLGIDDPVWDHSTFSKNRDRLLEGAVAGRFLSAMLAQPRVKRLLSSEHFSVDGTLIEAWASMKSFRPKAEGPDDPEPPGDRNPDANFRGETRSNATHASTTDPDAKLYRKGPGMEAKLCFIGHVLMENRSGLLVDTCLTQAGGHAERVAALAMIEPRADRPRAVTLGADRGYDTALNGRRPHDPSSRLRREPARPQAHRGGLRLDEERRWHAAPDAAWPCPGRVRLYLRGSGLQPRAPAQAPGGSGIVKAADNPVVGRWLIIESDLWDRAHLDLCGPAYLVVRANGDGEISFGALQASLDIDYGPNEIGFTWAGFDEMTEVSGAGSAEFQSDGTLLIKFEYHLGDEAVLKAARTPSSTAC